MGTRRSCPRAVSSSMLTTAPWSPLLTLTLSLILRQTPSAGLGLGLGLTLRVRLRVRTRIRSMPLDLRGSGLDRARGPGSLLSTMGHARLSDVTLANVQYRGVL